MAQSTKTQSVTRTEVVKVAGRDLKMDMIVVGESRVSKVEPDGPDGARTGYKVTYTNGHTKMLTPGQHVDVMNVITEDVEVKKQVRASTTKAAKKAVKKAAAKAPAKKAAAPAGK